MDLNEEIETMSWRRFQVLVSGLSGESALAYKLAREKEEAPVFIDDVMG